MLHFGTVVGDVVGKRDKANKGTNGNARGRVQAKGDGHTAPCREEAQTLSKEKYGQSQWWVLLENE